MVWCPEGTKIEWLPGALGEGDHTIHCVVCESIVSRAEIRTGICPYCGIRFNAAEDERDALRRKRLIDCNATILRVLPPDQLVDALRALPPDILRRVLQRVQS